MKTLALLLLCFTFSTLSAQDVSSTTSGFSAEVGGQYDNWSSNSNFISDLAEIDPDGYGYKLGVGYGFTEKFSLKVTYNGANFNQNDNWTKFTFTGLDVNGQITFGGTLQKFRPFLGAGISTRTMKVDPVTLDGFGAFELKNTGVGFLGTGGVNYHFLPNLAGAFQFSLIAGDFSDSTISGEEVDLEEDVDFTIIALSLGVKYFFEY